MSLAGTRSDGAWWRMPARVQAEQADRSLMAERPDGVEGLSVRPSAGPQSVVQDRQALLQAIAGFKGRGGGMAPAVWTRNAEGAGTDSAVAGGNRNLTRASLQDRGALV